MKNSFLFVLCFASILSPALLKAQYAIPNGSFENWTGINKPADWNVVQGKPTQGQVFNYTYIDSIGDTTKIERYPYHGASFIYMPMLDSATPCIISQKFAMTGRPRYFSMNYTYFQETRQNQFQVGFFFTKWNTTTKQEDTILAGDYNSKPGSLAPQLPWTNIDTADLTSLYYSNGNPDSALIVIKSSLQNSPGSKTLLAIDQIYFTDTAVTTGFKLPGNEYMTGFSVYPNPFSSKTTVRYSLKEAGNVSLDVYDMEGKQVASLVNGDQPIGFHQATFDAMGLTNGVYFYKLQSANDIQIGKLILAR